jgi:hypothetical protein
MSTVKLCPLMKVTCVKEGCQWWDADWQDCAANVMIKYLRAQDVRATFEHNVPAEFLEGRRT